MMGDETRAALYVVGPLNIDRRTKQANTVLGAILPLDTAEFEALDMLAARAGEPLTFERLYTAVWAVGDGPCEREAARLSLNHLLRQVNEAGAGFMWMEYEPETGYTLNIRWGRDWRRAK
jgi:DNA-binding response OmpR family regulator